MSDTPETEANRSFIEMETGYAWLCDCELTSNLERQRNDAMQLARELRDALDDMLMLRWPGARGAYVETTEKAESALTKANQLLK